MFKHALIVLASATAAFLNPVAAQDVQLETARISEQKQRLEFPLVGGNSAFKFNYLKQGAKTDNAAALQLRVTKDENPFLSTMPDPGQSSFLTFMKPCSILTPHVHQRATEFYHVLSGKMDAGIAQENGALQNITFPVLPGEVFTVPQGLLHHNHNQQCQPLVFLQTFNHADPGALTVINALAAFAVGDARGKAAMRASGAQGLQASPFAAFQLDQQCLRRCKLPSTGAPGNGLSGLPAGFAALTGSK